MEKWRWQNFWLYGLLALLVTGCPVINIANVGIQPDSVGEGQFTLIADVEVKYSPNKCEEIDDGDPYYDDCEDDPEVVTGRAVVGIWLPTGWEVSEARLRGPSDAAYEILPAEPSAAPAFPDTFPFSPGSWWPFVTECTEVSKGTFGYNFEFDVNGPVDQLIIPAGIGIGASGANAFLVDEGSVKAQDVMVEMVVDLEAGTVVPRKPTQDSVKLDLDECGADLLDVPQVSRGQRGCSCTTVGATGSDAG
jgi:hypothetical protein